MPELPEVETVVRDLRPHLLGRRLTTVEVGPQGLRRPWSAEWVPLLAGRRVEEVKRRGKWIVVVLKDDVHLVVHLGMTGQLTVRPATEPRADHTHVVFTLDDGREHLRFRDIRRFGSVSVFEDAESVGSFFTESGLGPEPWELKPSQWRALFARTDRSVKAVLLDQTGVAGVGNIYADESLYEARLHPGRIARTLDVTEARRLGRAVVKVLDRAINKRGSSIRDYVGGSGLRGEYQEEFRVYGRTGEPCRRCGTPIARIRMAGRSSHYCPRCQLAPTCGGGRPSHSNGAVTRRIPARGRG
jgi:formamidopyrimidine-DNA glycosylase